MRKETELDIEVLELGLNLAKYKMTLAAAVQGGSKAVEFADRMTVALSRSITRCGLPMTIVPAAGGLRSPEARLAALRATPHLSETIMDGVVARLGLRHEAILVFAVKIMEAVFAFGTDVSYPLDAPEMRKLGSRFGLPESTVDRWMRSLQETIIDELRRHLLNAMEKPSAPKKHVILFLAANPRTRSRLQLDEECAAIQRELKMVPHRDDFQFESRFAVSIDELMRHLNELAPTVIHFSGHGAGTQAEGSSATLRDIVVSGDHGGIYLQGDQGGSQLVTDRALTMMIQSAAASARVVVLNACYTESQAAAVRNVVECVVGMAGAIRDDAARWFAVGFYRALGNRCSVGNAFDQAVATLAGQAGERMRDELLPRCVTRDGVEANQVFLDPT